MITLIVKPCKKCGGVERRKNGDCRECDRERVRRWRKDSPDKRLAQQIAWRKNNSSKQSNNRIDWRNNNPYSATFVINTLCKMKVYIIGELKSSDIPPELVEIKRLQMQLHHAIKSKVAESHTIN